MGTPIRLGVSAYCVGLAGNSATANRNYYIAHPNVPVIRSVTANRNDVTSTVVIAYDSCADSTHPVDKMELYRLRDSELDNPSEVALESSGWTSVATADSKSCSMCDPLSDARPTERGKRTWYRLKATHGTHDTYSMPFELPIYDAPLTVTASGAYIASVMEADDGKSLAVEVAWRDDTVSGASASELAKYEFSTELSWGTTPYAWQSNKGAETFEFAWECTGDDKTTRLAAINANRPSVGGRLSPPSRTSAWPTSMGLTSHRSSTCARGGRGSWMASPASATTPTPSQPRFRAPRTWCCFPPRLSSGAARESGSPGASVPT